MSLLFSIRWIILSVPTPKPSMELASYKTVLIIFLVASFLFRIMQHICDINLLIQWMRIKISCLLVTPSHWLDQTSIVLDNFHLQLRCYQRIRVFIFWSHTCPTKISHGIFEILCIHNKYIPWCLTSCCRITRYHRLWFWFLRLASNLLLILCLFP